MTGTARGTSRAAAGSVEARYLTAKASVDDRALNRQVLGELVRLIPAGEPRLLEVGAGVGTMLARLLAWGVITAGQYTLLDADALLLRAARRWLQGWAADHGRPAWSLPDGLQIGDVRVRLVHAELGRYLRVGHRGTADVLIASAVLDLVDVPAVLPALLDLVRPNGVYWFTINYDGESIFAPEHPLDDTVLSAYHRDMDERIRYGRPAGDSRTGRHLFGHLRAGGAPVLAAGSSDWVVHAGPDGEYPADESYFLGRILDTIRDALAGRVDPAELAEWLDARRKQRAAGELLYIAHQLDVLGRAPRG
jgi:hypothetical protein